MAKSHAFLNARIHAWLADDFMKVVENMHSSNLETNSAAVWWFVNKLTAEERAQILGEYVRELAMQGQQEAEERETRREKAKGKDGGKEKG